MMTAEQLKESILQLAMQGKLVEQRPEEGTGEELYKEIIKERQRLVKEGRIKKDKDQSEKNEEHPFDIPESWKWAKLNDIVAKTIKRGKSPKYAQNSNTLVFAQKCNTKAGFIDLSLCLFLDEKLLPKYPEDEYMVNEDIVINSTGNGTLGRVGVYRDSDNPNKLPLVPDSHVTVIRCSSLMDVGYVYYCLKYYQPYMEKLGSGSTNQTELGAGVLKALLFPIPPLVEQKRIVAKIEELMPFVEQYAATSTKLNTLNSTFPEMMKKSILQEAVQGKLVPQDPNDEPASVMLKKIAEEKKRLIKEGKIKKQKPLPEITEDEIPFDIPESWEWVRLNNCLDVRDGTHDSPKYYSDGYPLVTSKNLKDGKIDFSTCKLISDEDFHLINQRSRVDDNDILFAMIGTVGNPVLFRGIADFSIKNMALFKHIGDYLNMEYVFWFLCYAQHNMKRQASGGVQSFVSLNYLRNYLIPLPPFEEQRRIVEVVKEEMLLIDKMNKER